MPQVGGGTAERIWLQRSIGYAGQVADAPLKTVTLVVDVPVYEYAPDGEDRVVRRATPHVLSGSDEHPLDETEYKIALDAGFIAGADPQAAERAAAYITATLEHGSADDLAVAGVCRYLTESGNEL